MGTYRSEIDAFAESLKKDQREFEEMAVDLVKTLLAEQVAQTDLALKEGTSKLVGICNSHINSTFSHDFLFLLSHRLADYDFKVEYAKKSGLISEKSTDWKQQLVERNNTLNGTS